MKAPTVSPLADGGFAIEAVVDKRGVNRLIPELKAAGATDILEMPISEDRPLSRRDGSRPCPYGRGDAG